MIKVLQKAPDDIELGILWYGGCRVFIVEGFSDFRLSQIISEKDSVLRGVFYSNKDAVFFGTAIYASFKFKEMNDLNEEMEGMGSQMFEDWMN